MHDRTRGELTVGTRRVVVGDHDLEPRRACCRYFVDGRDAAVDDDQQLSSTPREALDGRRREAVAVLESTWQKPANLSAQRAERSDKERRGTHAVDVVVAVDGDPRAPGNVTGDGLDRFLDALKLSWVVARLRVQKRPDGLRLGQP